MAQVYSFVDENGVTRLFAEIHPDPAGTPFNGGTITGPLVITDPVATDVPLTINGAAAQATDLFDVVNNAGTGGVFVFPTGSTEVLADDQTVALVVAATNSTVDVMQVQTAVGTVLAAVKAAGALATRAHAAPTNGAAKLMVKAKSANGTVATAAIPLT
jgi:hypothetical protein